MARTDRAECQHICHISWHCDYISKQWSSKSKYKQNKDGVQITRKEITDVLINTLSYKFPLVLNFNDKISEDRQNYFVMIT